MESYLSILELVGRGAWIVFGDFERATYTIIGAGAILLGLWLYKRDLLCAALLLGSGGFAVIFPLAGYHLGTMMVLLIAAYALTVAISLTLEWLRTGP
jgi:hypothetical protein